MRIVPQISMFEDTEIGELEKLNCLLDALPDERLISTLEKERGKGRNDYPPIVMWRMFIASFVFQHPTAASLLRELKRNNQLRQVCGIKPQSLKRKDGTCQISLAPSEAAFSRFLKNLRNHQKLLKEMFEELRDCMYEELEGFGEVLAIDGKIIPAYAKWKSKEKERDGRREQDADHTVKTYTHTTKSGEKVTKKQSWFGYRLHLIVDTTYELPVSMEVTKASISEQSIGKKLVADMAENVAKRCKYLTGDKGYDGLPFMKALERRDIIPIIDIRNCWKDKEQTHQYKDKDLVYSYDGKVYYVDETGALERLHYRGYDKETDSLRYGFKYKEKDNRIFRIRRKEEERIFLKVARDSHKFKRIYKKRTSIERVNGRIDRDYGFEHHTIRGIKKMEMFVTVSMIVMLGMAKAKIDKNGRENLNAWVA